MSLGRSNIILVALQCSLSIEPNISELLQDPHRTKPHQQRSKLLKKNYFNTSHGRNLDRLSEFSLLAKLFFVFLYVWYPAEFLVNCQAQQVRIRNARKN